MGFHAMLFVSIRPSHGLRLSRLMVEYGHHVKHDEERPPLR